MVLAPTDDGNANDVAHIFRAAPASQSSPDRFVDYSELIHSDSVFFKVGPPKSYAAKQAVSTKMITLAVLMVRSPRKALCGYNVLVAGST